MEIITTIASLGGLFLAGANVAIFCVVKFNDLMHLQKGLDEIKTKLDHNDVKLDKLGERVAKIEGKLS